MMLSRYELAELYMILGGIPYYLNLLDVAVKFGSEYRPSAVQSQWSVVQ